MSSAAAQRFPFPFEADAYRYSANVEPARTVHRTAAGGWGGHVIDLDPETYAADLAERRAVLAADPGRFQALPHTAPACWDALLTVLREAARDHPDDLTLSRLAADRFAFANRLRGTVETFALGDSA